MSRDTCELSPETRHCRAHQQAPDQHKRRSGAFFVGAAEDVAMVQTPEDLDLLSELIEAGKVRPRIDRRHPFADIPAAITYLEQATPAARSSWGWGEAPQVQPGRCGTALADAS
jgi:zinc-binding alcohol dehydrogenase family protein